jgi:hypothetical protein
MRIDGFHLLGKQLCALRTLLGRRYTATAVCCDTSLLCPRARWKTIRKHGGAETSRLSFYKKDKGSVLVLAYYCCIPDNMGSLYAAF